MSKIFFSPLILIASLTVAAEPLVDRWAAAVGAREKLGSLKSVYREANIQVGNYQGTIKVWHTADGKYRKEEAIATLSNTETFDGTKGMIKQNMMPARAMTESELAITRSKRFSNWNAIFFVFFPERHHGSVIPQNDHTLTFKPDGGIDWQVELDPKTWLPKSMTHDEAGRAITVVFDSYETIGGLQFEKEIHRTGGEMISAIRFTKTVINPSIGPSLFTIQ